MSFRSLVRYRCDRCGGEVELHPGDRPLLWGRVSIEKPPGSGRTPRRLGDLCIECVAKLDRWWQEPEPWPPPPPEYCPVCHRAVTGAVEVTDLGRTTVRWALQDCGHVVDAPPSEAPA